MPWSSASFPIATSARSPRQETLPGRARALRSSTRRHGARSSRSSAASRRSRLRSNRVFRPISSRLWPSRTRAIPTSGFGRPWPCRRGCVRMGIPARHEGADALGCRAPSRNETSGLVAQRRVREVEMTTILDGKALSERVRQHLASRVAVLKTAGRRAPGLAVVLVGDDPASQVYVGSKIKHTESVGMVSIEHRLPANTSEADLLALVDALNRDDAVDGILVQLPLPGHVDSEKVLMTIDPAKDVDGFHPVNAGKLAVGAKGLVPCTPRGCMALLKEARPDLSGLHAVVVGRSNIVGKPVAQLLLQENCTVTIAHSKTIDLPGVCRQADILVAAVGRPEMVRGDWIKPGAIVIDVGINRVAKPDGGSRIVGDVEYATAAQVAGAITPVPGGVGPMTIACLLENTLDAYESRQAAYAAAA